MAHGPWKKPLDFGGNPGHFTLGFGLGLGLGGVIRMGGYVLLGVCLMMAILKHVYYYATLSDDA